MQTDLALYRPTLIRTLWLSVGLLVAFRVTGVAQVDTSQDIICIFRLEAQPAYPGGFSKMKKYLKKNLKYPPAAYSAHIQGKVFVSFVVESNGLLTDVTVLKGLGYGCDEEAMRVVKAMPLWLPGSQSGRLIRVKYNLPIAFGIDFPERKGH